MRKIAKKAKTRTTRKSGAQKSASRQQRIDGTTESESSS
jgi:hypothetical protein